MDTVGLKYLYPDILKNHSLLDTNFISMNGGQVDIMEDVQNKKEKAEITDKIEKLIANGYLAIFFNDQINKIRLMETLHTDHEREEFINYFISTFLKEACLRVLKCEKCNIPFNFRHCKGFSDDDEPRLVQCIELSCSSCGDYFAITEGSQHVPYFNVNVLGKVLSLQKRGRGLSLKISSDIIRKPAVLSIGEATEPILWLDLDGVEDAQTVQKYWDKAKRIVKRHREGRKINSERISSENEILYLIQ